jgi:hypothetical protein
MMRTRLFVLVLLASPLHAAQTGDESPNLRHDMATIDGYFDAVRQRQGSGGSLAKPAADGRERDPFQVTPELRSRSERRQAARTLAIAAPGLSAGGEPLPPIRIKALALGSGRFAVLAVEEGGGKVRDIVVRLGERLQFGDGGVVRVRGISQDGVILHTGPGDEDVVLLK